jgi:hypothetical protein
MVKFCDPMGHKTMSNLRSAESVQVFSGNATMSSVPPAPPFHKFRESKIEMLLLLLFLNATIWTDMFDRIYYEC